MSNVLSIEELRKEFLEKSKPKDVKEFVEKQQMLLEKYMQENVELKKQLDHATELLKNSSGSLIIGQDNAEELICVEQIQILKERSRTRELDINDVKKLDILIKNLKLLRSEPTSNVNNSYRDVSDADLIAIAKSE
jgi:virulence-associated protein VapD